MVNNTFDIELIEMDSGPEEIYTFSSEDIKIYRSSNVEDELITIEFPFDISYLTLNKSEIKNLISRLRKSLHSLKS